MSYMIPMPIEITAEITAELQKLPDYLTFHEEGGVRIFPNEHGSYYAMLKPDPKKTKSLIGSLWPIYKIEFSTTEEFIKGVNAAIMRLSRELNHKFILVKREAE